MRASRAQAFFVLIVDEDGRHFDLLGPTNDDTYHTNKTAELQQQGRHVKCSTRRADTAVEHLIDTYARQTGYTFQSLAELFGYRESERAKPDRKGTV
jgi:hypothetical protein